MKVEVGYGLCKGHVNYHPADVLVQDRAEENQLLFGVIVTSISVLSSATIKTKLVELVHFTC